MGTVRVRLNWEEKQAILNECRSRNVSSGYNNIQHRSMRLMKKTSYKMVLRLVRDSNNILVLHTSDSLQRILVKIDPFVAIHLPVRSKPFTF